jgi:hypothetical protein
MNLVCVTIQFRPDIELCANQSCLDIQIVSDQYAGIWRTGETTEGGVTQKCMPYHESRESYNNARKYGEHLRCIKLRHPNQVGPSHSLCDASTIIMGGVIIVLGLGRSLCMWSIFREVVFIIDGITYHISENTVQKFSRRRHHVAGVTLIGLRLHVGSG